MALLLSACAHSPTYDPQDPLESVNRQIYRFNDTADRYIVRPVARGYVAVTPDLARQGVTNFFSNAAYPLTIVNQFLQGKPISGLSDIGRLVVNTTLGIGGLFDPASDLGLNKHFEDFGQTFGTWGVGQGWYLMLPFLGPSTNRDFTGRLLGGPFNAVNYIENTEALLALNVLDLINMRALLLSSDRLVRQQFDPYLFVRDAYLQSRRAEVHDGNPPPEPGDEEALDFGDEFELG